MSTEGREVLPLSRLEGACPNQLEVVKREWPNGIPLTDETAVRLAELDLDLDWAAKRLLPQELHQEFLDVTSSSRGKYEIASGQRHVDPNLLVEAVREYRRVAAEALLRLCASSEDKV